MIRNIEQYVKIDILEMYQKSNFKEWNQYLTKCLTTRDVNSLVQTMNGLQIGMADLAHKKLNHEELNVFFTRLIRSIEITMKKIYREIYPHMRDNALMKNHFKNDIEEKRKRDRDFEAFIRRNSY